MAFFRYCRCLYSYTGLTTEFCGTSHKSKSFQKNEMLMLLNPHVRPADSYIHAKKHQVELLLWFQAGEANGCEVHSLDQSGELTEALIMSL